MGELIKIEDYVVTTDTIGTCECGCVHWLLLLRNVGATSAIVAYECAECSVVVDITYPIEILGGGE